MNPSLQLVNNAADAVAFLGFLQFLGLWAVASVCSIGLVLLVSRFIEPAIERAITKAQHGGKVPPCTPGSCFCKHGCRMMMIPPGADELDEPDSWISDRYTRAGLDR